MSHLHPEARVGIVVEGAPGTVWIAPHPQSGERLWLCCDNEVTLLRLAKLIGVVHENAFAHAGGVAVDVDKAQLLDYLPSFIAAVTAGWAV